MKILVAVGTKAEATVVTGARTARAALDDLVKSRAYDRFRLSLIGGSS